MSYPFFVFLVSFLFLFSLLLFLVVWFLLTVFFPTMLFFYLLLFSHLFLGSLLKFSWKEQIKLKQLPLFLKSNNWSLIFEISYCVCFFKISCWKKKRSLILNHQEFGHLSIFQISHTVFHAILYQRRPWRNLKHEKRQREIQTNNFFSSSVKSSSRWSEYLSISATTADLKSGKRVNFKHLSW